MWILNTTPYKSSVWTPSLVLKKKKKKLVYSPHLSMVVLQLLLKMTKFSVYQFKELTSNKKHCLPLNLKVLNEVFKAIHKPMTNQVGRYFKYICSSFVDER